MKNKAIWASQFLLTSILTISLAACSVDEQVDSEIRIADVNERSRTDFSSKISSQSNTYAMENKIIWKPGIYTLDALPQEVRLEYLKILSPDL